MAALSFERTGNSGPIIILLHGFPFHKKIWKSFQEKLSNSCQVYSVDLPGFGESNPLENSFTIENVSHEISAWVEANALNDSTIIGHSLGGYVALAMAELRPDFFNGLVLFHSTAYPDSKERKESRNKVLEFIDTNGVTAFTSNFIAPLFSNPNHSAIPLVKSIAIQSSAEVVKGYTIAMRERPDRRNVLKNFKKPILFLAGEEDQGIPVDSVREQAALSPYAEVIVLPDVAHMGMFENESGCIEIISAFVNKNQLPNKR